MNQIPKRALEQHIIVLGKTRSGKSSAMRAAFVEPLLDDGKPVCIIDPKGDWWGIKSSKSGKSKGYPVVIFGGSHADVPIDEHSGSVVAELVATGNRPALIDLGGWMVGERTRFFNAFASTLFKVSRGQRWLVIDEVHNFAPQGGGFKNPDRNMMLHWANRLASEGLGRGINLIAASQRPQKVHKDFITSMETLVAMRVIHKLDRDAVKDWIDACGDPDVGKKIIGELAGFKRGEAYVYSPEIEFGPKHIQFEMFKTYDSFKPQPLDMQQLKGWAAVDLDEVRGRLEATVAKAEANDPAKLKKRILDLKQQLQNAEKSGDSESIVLALRGELDATRAECVQLHQHTETLAGKIIEANKVASVLREELSQAGERFTALSSSITTVEVPEMAEKPRIAELPPSVKKPETRPLIGANGGDKRDALNGPQRRIIDALAWLDSIGIKQPENAAVAFMAGYSPRGGAYQSPRSSLSTAGLIQYPIGGLVKLTEAGRAIANFPASATGPELRERVMQRLNGPQRRILQPLIEAYPNSMGNEALAAAAGYEPKGGAYQSPRSSLSTLGLIEYPSPGYVTARDILFPELTG